MLLRHVLLLFLVNFVSLQYATNTNQLGSILYENKARKGKTSWVNSMSDLLLLICP